MEQKFSIGGMNCAACSARVEKAVSSLGGVEKCSVNLLTNSMITQGSATNEEIIAAVEKAGYTAFLPGEKKEEKKPKDDEFAKLKNCLTASVVFLLALMYISMGHTMLGLPLPSFLADNPLSAAIAQMLLAIVVIVINKHFFTGGIKNLCKLSPNMDSLVAIGSGAAFVYSCIRVFNMSAALTGADHALVHRLSHDLYFESSAMILALKTFGMLLEKHSKGKTTSALEALIELTPKKATVIRNGEEITICASEIQVGDIFIVKPGEAIACDGIVTEGESAVDESALTGESIPVDKGVGSRVSAATINKFGHLKCRATHVGNETSFAKIIQMVTDAVSTKAPIAKLADKVSGVFVPSVMGIAIITCIVWLMVGRDAGFALERAISVLVISCPCALGLATPVAIMVGSGVGAKAGILFKTAQSLEQTGKARVCVFDKTGTITKGEPKVTDIYCADGCNEEELTQCAYSLEMLSEHPLSKAICNFAKEKGTTAFAVSEFEAKSGSGLVGTCEKGRLIGGNVRFLKENTQLTDEITKKADEYSLNGKTPLLFSLEGKLLGMICVSDTIKDDAKEAIKKIKDLGIKTVMLTGDNINTAKAIAAQCDIDETIADVLPDQKASVIENLQKENHVIMVGDGINDAPALAMADVGIAIGAGTDIAIESADVVVTKSTITDVVNAIVLSKHTMRNIKQNLFWAFCYNSIGIPLAAGVWINLFGWSLNPMFGAAAMSLSSFCVVSNALRLNLIKFDKGKKEKMKMEKTVKIEGMMCPHCEARVKSALEQIDGVTSVTPSHETKTALIVCDKDVPDELIKATIEAQGYKVI